MKKDIFIICLNITENIDQEEVYITTLKNIRKRIQEVRSNILYNYISLYRGYLDDNNDRIIPDKLICKYPPFKPRYSRSKGEVYY